MRGETTHRASAAATWHLGSAEASLASKAAGRGPIFALVSRLIEQLLAQFYSTRPYGFVVTTVHAPVCFSAAVFAAVITLGRVAYAHTFPAHLQTDSGHISFVGKLARSHLGERYPCHISHHPRDGSRAPRHVCPTMIARALVPQGGAPYSIPSLVVAASHED